MKQSGKCPKCGSDDESMLEKTPDQTRFCNICAHEWSDETADPTTPVLRPDRMGGVLDHHQTVSSGDVHDRVHVAWAPVEMNRENRLGAFRHGRFESCGINRACGIRLRTRD